MSMANFGNLPFRRICKEYGADVTCSEMVIATSILEVSGGKANVTIEMREMVIK